MITEPLFSARLEGVEFEVYGTPVGYLLFWGDYVANTWVMAYESLAEVFAMLEKIAKDTYQ
jgi:hypothetical protein